MHNWSTNTSELKKDKRKYAVWKLEQLINFGLDQEKLKREEVIKFWPELKIDTQKKKFLELLLWPQF